MTDIRNGKHISYPADRLQHRKHIHVPLYPKPAAPVEQR